MPVEKKPTKSKPKNDKQLKELKATNKILKEIRDILDNTWRGREPY